MGDNNKENLEPGAEESSGEKFVEAQLPTKVSPWQLVVPKKIMSDPKTQDTTVYPKRKYDKKILKKVKWIPLRRVDTTETVDIKEELEDDNEIQNLEIPINERIGIEENACVEELTNIFRVSVNLDASKGFSCTQKNLMVKDKTVFIEEEEDVFIISNHNDVFVKHEGAIDTEITEQQSTDKQTQDDLLSNKVLDNERSNCNDSKTFNSNEASDSDYESYPNDSDIDKGKIRKKKRKIYTCVECQFTGVYRDYQIHIQECPLKGRYIKSADKSPRYNETWSEYYCSKCKTTFSTMRQYLHHLTLKHNLNHGVCPKCGVKTKNLAALESHIMWHIKRSFELKKLGYLNQGVWVYCCTSGCTRIVEEGNFFSHWESHIKFTVNNSKNDVAEETVRARLRNKYKALSEEMVNVVLNEITEMNRYAELVKFRTCVVCKRQFSSINDCKRHLVEHLLVSHEVLSPRPQHRTFYCQFWYCHHYEDNLADYKEHLRDHAGLPQYKCGMCYLPFGTRTFSHSTTYIKHMKMHKRGAGACKMCGKKFWMDLSLRRHVRMHFSTKPVTCCGGQIFFQSQLKRHIRSEHEKKKGALNRS